MSVFSQKESFHLLKSLPYNYGKAKNKPVVVGRLVESCVSASMF